MSNKTSNLHSISIPACNFSIFKGLCGMDHCLQGSTIKISNGNRTKWSPIQSVIIRVITKSDDREAGVRFVYHEYDYRLNWTTRSPIIN